MEAAIYEKKETTLKEEKKGKRKWGKIFIKFISMGGFIVIILIIIGIALLIEKIFK